jgi:hypothetical protein
VPGYRYLIRAADGHYLGEHVTDRWEWSEGDVFTDPGGRQFRIVAIEQSRVLGAIQATWRSRTPTRERGKEVPHQPDSACCANAAGPYWPAWRAESAARHPRPAVPAG